jgi:hypothetical protein
MSEIVESLLLRNLTEVFSERDHDRRREAICELYAEDCVFVNPAGRGVGHDWVDATAIAIQDRTPDGIFSQQGLVEAFHGVGRVKWAFGPPEDPMRDGGEDVIVERGGRIAALYGFGGPSPELDAIS